MNKSTSIFKLHLRSDTLTWVCSVCPNIHTVDTMLFSSFTGQLDEKQLLGLTTSLNPLLTSRYKSRHVLVALHSALCSTTSTGRTQLEEEQREKRRLSIRGDRTNQRYLFLRGHCTLFTGRSMFRQSLRNTTTRELVTQTGCVRKDTYRQTQENNYVKFNMTGIIQSVKTTIFHSHLHLGSLCAQAFPTHSLKVD